LHFRKKSVQRVIDKSNPYLKLLKEQEQEELKKYFVDGLYLPDTSFPINAFNGSLVFLPRKPKENEIEHENTHLQNVSICPELAALLSCPGELDPDISETVRVTDMIAMKNYTRLLDFKLKCEILAFKAEGEDPMPFLRNKKNLYDVTEELSELFPLPKEELFKMAFLALPYKDQKDPWQEIWQEKLEQIQRWCDIYDEINDYFLLVAVPIEDWEHLLEEKEGVKP